MSPEIFNIKYASQEIKRYPKLTEREIFEQGRLLSQEIISIFESQNISLCEIPFEVEEKNPKTKIVESKTLLIQSIDETEVTYQIDNQTFEAKTFPFLKKIGLIKYEKGQNTPIINKEKIEEILTNQSNLLSVNKCVNPTAAASDA